jgi:hypothetical protein
MAKGNLIKFRSKLSGLQNKHPKNEKTEKEWH